MIRAIIDNWNNKKELDDLVEIIMEYINDGYFSAAIILGELYENNELFKHDQNAAFKCYEYLIKNNVMKAHNNLNLVDYYLRNIGISNRNDKIIYYMDTAKSDDDICNAEFKYLLGYMYENGIVLNKNTYEAFKCYTDAFYLFRKHFLSSTDYINCCKRRVLNRLALGRCYLYGIGVEESVFDGLVLLDLTYNDLKDDELYKVYHLESEIKDVKKDLDNAYDIFYKSYTDLSDDEYEDMWEEYIEKWW